jgi:hypothetical protein
VAEGGEGRQIGGSGEGDGGERVSGEIGRRRVGVFVLLSGKETEKGKGERLTVVKLLPLNWLHGTVLDGRSSSIPRLGCQPQEPPESMHYFSWKPLRNRLGMFAALSLFTCFSSVTRLAKQFSAAREDWECVKAQFVTPMGEGRRDRRRG